MSSQVFPTLDGIDIAVTREAVWEGTDVVRAVSGKRTAIAYWANPIWQWTLRYNFLRSIAGTDFQTLVGFFNARQGQFDSFLFDDTDDNIASGQLIGTGNGSQTAFQLVRAFGGFVEPMLAPNTVFAVALNGVTQAPGTYSVSAWGTSAPGVLTFNSAPLAGRAITATFTYYWPCEFMDPTLSFDKFMFDLWSQGGVKLRSLK